MKKQANRKESKKKKIQIISYPLRITRENGAGATAAPSTIPTGTKTSRSKYLFYLSIYLSSFSLVLLSIFSVCCIYFFFLCVFVFLGYAFLSFWFELCGVDMFSHFFTYYIVFSYIHK